MSQALTAGVEELYAPDFSGPKSFTGSTASFGSYSTTQDWSTTWSECYRPVYFGAEKRGVAYWITSPTSFELIGDAMPVLGEIPPSQALTYLHAIQIAFGDSASHLAKILRVSRQMIYHYRQGMEPALDNFRRMRLIGDVAREVVVEGDPSLEPLLKLQQPEGQTLLAFLSEDNPNVPALRRIMLRASTDLARRRRLAESLAASATENRDEIMKARHKEGMPIYVTDPSTPGKVIQIGPDKSRVRGRVVNRQFVPDEE